MNKNNKFETLIISEIQSGVNNARKEIAEFGAYIPHQHIRVEISVAKRTNKEIYIIKV